MASMSLPLAHPVTTTATKAETALQGRKNEQRRHYSHGSQDAQCVLHATSRLFDWPLDWLFDLGTSMRVRIKRHWEYEDGWLVESYHWYNFKWVTEKYVIGDDAEKRALKYARDMLDPVIIEITKNK